MAAIVIGNGTPASVSTVNGVSVHGPSSGLSSGTGTSLVYAAASGGTVLRVVGGISGLNIGDLLLNCSGLAGTGINLDTVQESTVRNVQVASCTSAGCGFNINTDTASVTGLGGSSGNIIENVFVDSTVAGSKGFNIGSAIPLPADVLQSLFINCRTYVTGPNGIGANFGLADALTFVSPLFEVTKPGTGSYGLQVSATPGNYAFPSGISFMHPVIGGPNQGYNVVGPWIGYPGIQILGLSTPDQEPIPTVNFIDGFTDSNVPFGQAAPLRYAAIADSATLNFNDTAAHAFNKQYTIKSCINAVIGDACGLNVAGTVVRVRASGIYTTSGAPSLEILLANSGSLWFAAGIMATATNAVNRTWTASGEFVVRTPGTGTNNCEMGGGIFGADGGSVVPSGTFGAVTYNTQADFTVTVFAAFLTANTTNAITLKTLDVEVLYPGAAN
jgi:hypothetical protein